MLGETGIVADFDTWKRILYLFSNLFCMKKIFKMYDFSTIKKKQKNILNHDCVYLEEFDKKLAMFGPWEKAETVEKFTHDAWSLYHLHIVITLSTEMSIRRFPAQRTANTKTQVLPNRVLSMHAWLPTNQNVCVCVCFFFFFPFRVGSTIPQSFVDIN